MTPTARSSSLAAALALAALLPAGTAWAQPAAASGQASVLRQAPLVDDEQDGPDDPDDLDVDDTGDALADDSDAVITDDLSDEGTPGEVVFDEEADDGDYSDDDDAVDDSAVSAAASSSLAAVRRTGSVSTGSVRLSRGGTVTQVVTMRDHGRTLVVARSKRRIGAGGTLKIKAKLNQAGRRAIAASGGTVRLKVRTTVAPKGGAKKVTVRTVTLRSGS